MWSFVRKVTQQSESLEDRFGLSAVDSDEVTDMKTDHLGAGRVSVSASKCDLLVGASAIY